MSGFESPPLRQTVAEVPSGARPGASRSNGGVGPRRFAHGREDQATGLLQIARLRAQLVRLERDAPEGKGDPNAENVVGHDGIGTGYHTISVVALDEGDVCDIPYAHSQSVAGRSSRLRHQVHKWMSYEIVREQDRGSISA